MPRRLFRFALLCQLLLVVLHLWLVRAGAVPDTPLFREFQGFVWRTIPRWRIFVGLHALVLTIVGCSVGFSLLAWFRPSGRWLFGVGLLAYLIYLRLEPRFFPSDWGFIAAVCACELGGVFTLLLVAGSQSEHTPRSNLSAAFYGLAGGLLTFSLYRFARDVPVVGAVPGAAELSSFTVFFGAGYLLALSRWGSVAPCFKRPPLSEPGAAASAIRRGLLLHILGGIVIAAAIIVLNGVPLIWAFVAPFAPFIVAGYAPYSWFGATGDTVVFSRQLAPDAATLDLALRNRLLLGILFQYLCVGLVAVLWRAFRATRIQSAVFAAHGVLLLYWLPVFWLCQMLADYRAP